MKFNGYILLLPKRLAIARTLISNKKLNPAWQKLWYDRKDSCPNTITDTLFNKDVCPIIFPNITKILNLVLLTAVTTCSVERANSSLRFVKNHFRSMMSEDRLNALVLLFIHKDIKININSIIDMYANKHPRRMLLQHPLED